MCNLDRNNVEKSVQHDFISLQLNIWTKSIFKL